MRVAMAILASLALAAPALAQDWGGDYNMGSIGVTGGNSASGTIMLDCAEGGNGVVPQGALSIFFKARADSRIGAASPGNLRFSVDGTDVSLPVSDDKGDGFVYEKTPETLVEATQLVDLLKAGKQLSVSADGAEIAQIDLKGAAAALVGVEACLVP
jgi:hypothetical protein